ncbi:MAG: phosphatidylglycerophosphatase A, partial [Fimbriimonadales bacterium]
PQLWRVSLIIVGLAVLVTIAGLAVSGRVETACGVKDPSPVVIDEVAGQLLASAPTAMFLGPRRVTLLVISFALFRLFDIWKPWPIRRLEKLPGGWGIMLDDVAAGILAGFLTYGIGSIMDLFWR